MKTTDYNIIRSPFVSADDETLYIDGSHRVTFGQFDQSLRQWSQFLQNHAIVQRDHVLIATKDDLAVLTAFIGCLYYGAIPVIIDPALTQSEISDVLKIVNPKALIVDHGVMKAWNLVEAGDDRLTVAVGRDAKAKPSLVSKLLKKEAKSPTAELVFPDCLKDLDGIEVSFQPAGEDAAYVLFTSGTTTSTSKASVIPWRAIHAHLKTLARQFEYTEQTRVLNMQPLQHTDGLMLGGVLSYIEGATLVRGPAFSAESIPQLLDLINEKAVTHLAGVPTMFAMILGLYASKDAPRFTSLNYVLSSSAILEESLWQNMESFFRCRVTNHYGLTETVVSGLFSGPDDDTWKMGTIGKPVDCEIRIVNTQGQDVAVGEPGELWMKGDHVFSGYLDSSGSIHSPLKENWLPTGDLVQQDADGYISLVGRLKNIIISGGKNISPEEISAVLNEHPSVQEAYVVGVDDPIWGETIVAAIVPLADAIDRKILLEHCRCHLANYKIPKKFMMVERLPKGLSGKVRIAELKSMIASMTEDKGDVGGNSIEQKVISIAADTFGLSPSDLSLASEPENTAPWDSFAHLNFVMALEDHFSISLSPMQVMSLNSLSKAAEIVLSQTSGK